MPSAASKPSHFCRVLLQSATFPPTFSCFKGQNWGYFPTHTNHSDIKQAFVSIWIQFCFWCAQKHGSSNISASQAAGNGKERHRLMERGEELRVSSAASGGGAACTAQPSELFHHHEQDELCYQCSAL